MAILKCPDCRKKFPWNIRDAGYPDECPLCHAFVGSGRADDDICMPSIRSLKTAATDKVYRDIEAASETRMHQAAEMAGVPASDMSDLKITDLRPTTRPGDVAAPSLTGSAAALEQHMQHMQQQGKVAGFGAGAAGAELGGGIQTGAVTINGQILSGIAPNAGAHARVNFRDIHQQRMSGALTGADVTSDRPALETMQPGYRVRA